VPYHRFAELIGLKGIFCDHPDHVADCWDEALSSHIPVAIEFKTDPEVPPLPAHISFEQAKHLARTLIEGDPNEGALIKGTIRQAFSELLPHDKE
jgi:pyruvate dehydrogenase (quinone)